MHGMLRGLAAALLPLAAAPALAATATGPDGKRSELAAGQEVAGPATVATDDGDSTIRLRAGAVLRFLGAETGEGGGRVERFFLKRGGADASTGTSAQVATPAFWAFPEKAGARASYYVESPDGRTGYARAAGGAGLLRLLAGEAEIHLAAGQGVTVPRGEEGSLGFATDAGNPWRAGAVRVFRPLGDRLRAEIYVPQATEGVARPDPGNPGVLVVENGPSSWGSGRIRCVSVRGPKDEVARAEVGPGASLSMDAGTGAIAVLDRSGRPGSAPEPGAVLPLPPPARVVIRSFAPALAPGDSRARTTLANEGPPIAFCRVDTRFAFPAPPGTPGPLEYAVVPSEIADWKGGEERTIDVRAPRRAGAAYFVRLRAFLGQDLPATAARESSDRGVRPGSLLLDGRVEVVGLDADLSAERPSLSFTLENVDGERPEEPVGDLRYVLELWKSGSRIDLGPGAASPRPVGAPLGKAGDRVVLAIGGLERAAAPAGAKPVLRLMR